MSSSCHAEDGGLCSLTGWPVDEDQSLAFPTDDGYRSVSSSASFSTCLDVPRPPGRKKNLILNCVWDCSESIALFAVTMQVRQIDC